MALTEKEIKYAKQGSHVDGNGLYLQVASTGAKSWIFRYQLNGRRRAMGLGSLKTLDAKNVRLQLPDLHKQLANGIDPIEERKRRQVEKTTKVEEAALKATNFKQAAEQLIENKKPGWGNEKHAWQWSNSLELYAYPVLGSVPVGNVTTEHVLQALTPIWVSKTETAKRVRQRIESVLDFAKTKNWRSGDNPATWRGNLEHILPDPSDVTPVEHQPALPFRQMPKFMEELRARKGSGARALELCILTVARSSQVRGARWDEVDFDERIWIVPKVRMKGKKKSKREHRVPLCDRALALLKNIPRVEGEPLIFPGRKAGQPLSDMTLRKVTLDINADRAEKGLPLWVDGQTGEKIVPHGFRSTFRDWASDVTHYPNEMAEMALAHVVSDKVEAAYRRSDMFDKRRHMIEDWAAWCEPKDSDVVLVLPRVA
jgi:integrase